jgi:hypothetical protein
MPIVGFEPTIRVFERAKTVHALALAATVMGPLNIWHWNFYADRYLTISKSYRSNTDRAAAACRPRSIEVIFS